MTQNLALIGWQELGALPELDIPAIYIKVDTGAKTSALHAKNIEAFTKDGKRYVRFTCSPVVGDDSISRLCEAPLIDERVITNSGGQSEHRYVIRTLFKLGSQEWPIQITLTDRSNMRFAMLLGRRAMQNKYLVDTSATYIHGNKNINSFYTS